MPIPANIGKRAGCDIADDHFNRDNLDLFDELFAHVEATDEMARDTDMAEQRKNMLADAIVDHALAVDRALFLGVESGGIILEILDDGTGFGAFV